MNALEAETRLEIMTQYEVEPKLTQQEITLLLNMFARADAAGIAHNDAGWSPTYDFNAAAAEGWRWKAAKASELVSVDLDGERMSSNQIFDHCERMAKMYSRRKSGSVSFGK